MGCRKLIGSWMGAALVSAAALATAPLVLGGGGDEGVDILPYIGGGSSASLPDSAPGGMKVSRPLVGFVAIHGRKGADTQPDANGFPIATGLVIAPHTRSDLFQGTVGNEPLPRFGSSLDLRLKGPRKLFFGEMAASPGGLAARSFLNLNGRFEVEDLRSDDGETLELVARQRMPAVMTVVVGKRSTTDGGILASFKQVDYVVTDVVASGSIDLAALRAECQAELAGSGCDVGVVLFATTPRGVDEAWAAFNVDDARAIFDIEIKLK